MEYKQNIDLLFKANIEAKGLLSESINEYLKNNLSELSEIFIGEIPYVLQKIGLDVGLIKTNYRILNKIKEKHNNAWDEIVNIMDYIADPIAVFGSLEMERSIIIIGNKELKSRDNNPLRKELLTIVLTPDGKIQDIDGHYTILNSIYGFNEFDIEKHLGGKRENDILGGTLKYINEKALEDVAVPELQGTNLQEIYSMMRGWSNFKSRFNILTKETIINAYLQQQSKSQKHKNHNNFSL